MRVHLLTIVLVLMSVGRVQAPPEDKLPPLTSDVALIPHDAVLFVHVRMADVWNHDAMKPFRAIVKKAGAEALKAFDSRFLPTPSTIERVTVFVLPPPEPDLLVESPIIALIATSKPIDRQPFFRVAFPNAVELTVGKKHYFRDATNDTAVFFPDDRTLGWGRVDDVVAYLKYAPKAGPLGPAIELTRTGKAAVIGFNPAVIPAKGIQEMQAEIRPLFKADLVTLSLDLNANAQVIAHARYPDENSAEQAQDAVKQAAERGVLMLNKRFREEFTQDVVGDGKPAPLSKLPRAAVSIVALGAIQEAEDFLRNLPLVRKKNTLEVTAKLPKEANFLLGTAAMGIGLAMPAAQEFREQQLRLISQDALKNFGLAMHNYAGDSADACTLPAAAICDKKGKPLLSWRVAILPHIEQEPLYNQFKLDEPWDSEHNKKLIERMPKIYLHPKVKNPTPGHTNYRVFVGNGALFDWKKGGNIATIPDGTSQTLMVVETTETTIWTKPDDFEYDPKKPLPKLGGLSRGGFNILLADGSVHFVRDTISEKTLRALIECNDGAPLGEDFR